MNTNTDDLTKTIDKLKIDNQHHMNLLAKYMLEKQNLDKRVAFLENLVELYEMD